MKNLLPTRNAVQVLYMALALRFRQLPPDTSRQLPVSSYQSPVEARLSYLFEGEAGGIGTMAPLYVQEIDT